MKISRMTREQKDFFLDMDPLMMMDRLDFPNTFALIATLQNEEAGDSGQDLFLKNVMSNYFRSVPVIDKRSMLASALRRVKPRQMIQRLHELKPLSDSNSPEENQKIQEESMLCPTFVRLWVVL